MRLPRSLSYLVDSGVGAERADDFLAALGGKLIEDGLLLAGGALSQASPHPIIARRTWLWRADTAQVVEALGFAGSGLADSQHEAMSRDWLAGLGEGSLEEHAVGSQSDRTTLSWSSRQALSASQSKLLRDVARFASAPLAAITARSTMATLLETYLGRRSAARVLSGRLRREPGETIRAALLFADMRGFTALSEASKPEDVIAALDAWFDRPLRASGSILWRRFEW
jgi:adenylate cyclase